MKREKFNLRNDNLRNPPMAPRNIVKITNTHIMKISMGDAIKVTAGKDDTESFWVQIMETSYNGVDLNGYYAKVDNDLLKTELHGYEVNDLVFVFTDQIQDILYKNNEFNEGYKPSVERIKKLKESKNKPHAFPENPKEVNENREWKINQKSNK